MPDAVQQAIPIFTHPIITVFYPPMLLIMRRSRMKRYTPLLPYWRGEIQSLNILFHGFIQTFLLRFQGKQIIPLLLYNCSAILYWHPIASIVTIHPTSANFFNKVGIAVISLLFSSVFTCPKADRFRVAHALTT
jgi:hypothetical protein